MNLTAFLILTAVVTGSLLLKRLSFVSAQRALQLLKEGALVVNVRDASEFKSRHLEGALNLPLSELIAQAPRHLPDRTRPLLLHCLSGGRSGVARGQLRRMGYTSVFNLGSYGRAEALLRSAKA